MNLYLVEFEEKSTGKLREPYLLGEDGLYDLAKELDPDISVDSLVDVLIEYGYEITEIETTYDLLNMFDNLKANYMNY